MDTPKPRIHADPCQMPTLGTGITRIAANPIKSLNNSYITHRPHAVSKVLTDEPETLYLTHSLSHLSTSDDLNIICHDQVINFPIPYIFGGECPSPFLKNPNELLWCSV